MATGIVATNFADSNSETLTSALRGSCSVNTQKPPQALAIEWTWCPGGERTRSTRYNIRYVLFHLVSTSSTKLSGLSGRQPSKSSIICFCMAKNLSVRLVELLIVRTSSRISLTRGFNLFEASPTARLIMCATHLKCMKPRPKFVSSP